MTDLEAARAWTRARCSALANAWQVGTLSRGPNNSALWAALGIVWTTTSDGHRQGYRVSEEAGHYLHHMARRCPDTYLLAVDLACQYIGTGIAMPTGLRDFVCGVLFGYLQCPKRRGRDRAKNWTRDYVIFEMLEELVERFGVRPTRNDVTKEEASACDLVSQAFAAAGDHTLTYKTVKTIWLNKSLRREARTIRELRDRSDEGPPAFVELREPPFPVS